MKRIAAVLIVWSSVTLGVVQGVPARPLFVPDELPKAPTHVPIDLRGTTWRGMDLIANRVLVFNADGTIHYGSNKIITIKTGRATWRLDGHDLYFEMNNQYREFKGKVIGDTIVGDSWNKAGNRWKTELRRDREAK